MKTGVMTVQDLIDLTGGLKQGAAQIRWIEQNIGIKCPRKIDGHPLLTWEQYHKPTEASRKANINWEVA
jgi:hypothetical protein